MTRKRYIVSYDIANPKRLRYVARLAEGFGYRLQFSVFECLLDPLRKEEMKAGLTEIINHAEDQVLFIALGTKKSDASLTIESLGRPYKEHSRITII
jgi:CRISPR-associated protein Cas2